MVVLSSAARIRFDNVAKRISIAIQSFNQRLKLDSFDRCDEDRIIVNIEVPSSEISNQHVPFYRRKKR